MRLLARLASPRGLLLVEAVLSAVVIAVGLAFITRSLGGQLRALESVEAYDTLFPLAQSKLTELEAWGLKQKPIPHDQLEGLFDEPNHNYRWVCQATPHAVPADSPALSDVSLSVYSEQNPKRKVTLFAVWPGSWFQGGG